MENNDTPAIKVTNADRIRQRYISLGIDPDEIALVTMMQCIFVDIADSYASHLKSIIEPTDLYRHNDKQAILKIKTLCHDLASSISRHIGVDLDEEAKLAQQIDYGDRCDFIRDCALLLSIIAPDDRIKVLSTLKLFAKCNTSQSPAKG